MVNVEKSENQAFLEKSIQHLEATGFEDIKADMEGYETPKSYIRKGHDAKITPDIVALKNGRKYYFEISLKSGARRDPQLTPAYPLGVDAVLGSSGDEVVGCEMHSVRFPQRAEHREVHGDLDRRMHVTAELPGRPDDPRPEQRSGDRPTSPTGLPGIDQDPEAVQPVGIELFQPSPASSTVGTPEPTNADRRHRGIDVQHPRVGAQPFCDVLRSESVPVPRRVTDDDDQRI